ncbi:TonB-dependent receptor [Paraburkholderia tropica]|uniref:Iron complex outermembrane recepter protein n=1 Tax=Paraburkholderia tropica TaxID=92647 RepID=A0AAQ1JU29_9BURK|nr:TonB-dependent receptor [Paraburkholderia tropica]RQN38928.1 TonB-dependent receptor [Paraburkholderia tropica]SEJ62174.1 iron complex outermembrane recepter protein [Paraburkholderia tropica]
MSAPRLSVPRPAAADAPKSPFPPAASVSRHATRHASRHAILAAIAVAFALPAAAFAQTSGNADAGNTGNDAATAGKSNATLPTVKVQAAKDALPGDLAPTYGGGQVARGGNFGALGQQKNIDMPFSMTTYTAKAIQDKQARTIADVLSNDPAVRTAYGYGNFQEVYVIRGFQLDSDDVSLNGLYGITPRQMVETPAIERVDVFKGASAFLNGASPNGSSIGGSVNLQLKRADDKPLTEVTLDGSASGEFGTHVDVGRRFGDQDQFGIRVNQANRDGETSIDGEHRRNNQTAVALDYRGEKLRLEADFLYQRQHVSDGRPVAYVSGDSIPAVPSASYNYGQTWSASQTEDTVGILRAEYDFLPGWTAYVAGGARHSTESGQYSSPYYTDPTLTTASRMYVPRKEDATSAEVGVRGHFNTGPVSHFVTAGASIVSVHTESAWNMSGSFNTDLYDTPQVAFPPSKYYSQGLDGNPPLTSTSLMRSVAASDTLGFFHDRVLFTVGVRHQEIVSNAYSSSTLLQTEAYNDSITTPLFGIVFKPTEHIAIYANRSESLAAGSQAPATAMNANALLAPERTKQYEVGAKYDSGKFGAQLALYQLEKPQTYTNSSGYFVADGNERHRGVEASVFGEVYKGVRLMAGATYINAVQLDTGTNDGNRPIGVPSFMFNLGAEYDLPWVQGLTFSARYTHTGPQYLNATNTLSIKAWDTVDLGARYKTSVFGRPTTFRADVYNLTNKAYWSSTTGGYLTMGAPRTVLFSMTTDF